MVSEEIALTMREADEQLLIEAAQKDPSRFAELYEANFTRVYAFIAGRVRNRAEAQDITSDVFHKALANLGSFKWRGAPFAAWLFRIAANTLADRSQRAARERGLPTPDGPPEPAAPHELEQIEQRGRLFRLVNSLSADQRRVITLRFTEERSIREIAREMGRSEGAVKQLQFRALDNLRTWMTNQRGGSDG
jgi:RNA polymerase sigma-70 factor, ECF subfamily